MCKNYIVVLSHWDGSPTMYYSDYGYFSFKKKDAMLMNEIKAEKIAKMLQKRYSTTIRGDSSIESLKEMPQFHVRMYDVENPLCTKVEYIVLAFIGDEKPMFYVDLNKFSFDLEEATKYDNISAFSTVDRLNVQYNHRFYDRNVQFKYMSIKSYKEWWSRECEVKPK